MISIATNHFIAITMLTMTTLFVVALAYYVEIYVRTSHFVVPLGPNSSALVVDLPLNSKYNSWHERWKVFLTSPYFTSVLVTPLDPAGAEGARHHSSLSQLPQLRCGHGGYVGNCVVSGGSGTPGGRTPLNTNKYSPPEPPARPPLHALALGLVSGAAGANIAALTVAVGLGAAHSFKGRKEGVGEKISLFFWGESGSIGNRL